MASRTPPARTGSGRAPGGRPSTSGRGSRRAAPVKKPFPVGFAVGCTVLALALIAVIVFAVRNQGIGATGTLKQADQISGLKVTAGLARTHAQGVLRYPGQATVAPDGGPHNPIPQTCQVYSKQIPNENAVHSLEHGAVWITYDPGRLSAADVKVLATEVTGQDHRLLSPYPGQSSSISLQAWGRRLQVERVTDKRIASFLKNFTGGPQAPERGAQCTGSATTGATPAAAPGTLPGTAGTPAPQGSAAPGLK